MNSYQIVGKNIKYTLSPLIYEYLASKYQVNIDYRVNDVNSVTNSIIESCNGGNITIPFKNEVFKMKNSNYSFDEICLRDQSTNCYKQVGNDYLFTSTDQYGLKKTFLKFNYPKTKTSHIIRGDGATALMIYNTLINDFKISSKDIFLISRKNHNPAALPQIIGVEYLSDYKFENYYLYNATPLGNVNNKELSPFSNDMIKVANGIFDANYLPFYNHLHKQAITANVKYLSGLVMLVYQGIESFSFWTNLKLKDDYEQIYNHLLFKGSTKLIVCAMPFAGKSTLQKKYNEYSVDLDKCVEHHVKMPVSKYIEKYGLDQFRDQEKEVLKLLLKRKERLIIFLGGGTFTNEEARNLLSDELVVYMHVNLHSLKQRFNYTRANIKSKAELAMLYQLRNKLYQNLALITVKGERMEEIINEYYNY